MKNSLKKNNKLNTKIRKSKRNKKWRKKYFYNNNTFIKNDNMIDTTKTFWEERIKEGIEEKWYNKAIDKWSNKPASISGVLDGFVNTSQPDLKESANFLDKLANIYGKNTNKHICANSNILRAIDCGAGIGRITSNILLQRFDFVDLVEPVKHFIDKSKLILSSLGHKGNFYNNSLQNFYTDEKYDCIWIQWVLGQLTDNDVIVFLKRCKHMLNNNGVIIIKENIISKDFIIDDRYNLITRNYNDMRKIFMLSGLNLIYEENQKDFPSYLVKVNIFALE